MAGVEDAATVTRGEIKQEYEKFIGRKIFFIPFFIILTVLLCGISISLGPLKFSVLHDFRRLSCYRQVRLDNINLPKHEDIMRKLESALSALPTNCMGMKYLIGCSTISILSDLICRYNLYGRKSCLRGICHNSQRRSFWMMRCESSSRRTKLGRSMRSQKVAKVIKG